MSTNKLSPSFARPDSTIKSQNFPTSRIESEENLCLSRRLPFLKAHTNKDFGTSGLYPAIFEEFEDSENVIQDLNLRISRKNSSESSESSEISEKNEKSKGNSKKQRNRRNTSENSKNSENSENSKKSAKTEKSYKAQKSLKTLKSPYFLTERERKVSVLRNIEKKPEKPREIVAPKPAEPHDKAYFLISKFFLIKKFIKNLRNATFLRLPTRLQLSKLHILNDLSFFKEGALNNKKFKEKAASSKENHAKEGKNNGVWRRARVKLKQFVCKKVEKYVTVFDPAKSLRTLWDALHLLVLLFLFFKLPVELSFEVNLLEFLGKYSEIFASFANYFPILFLLFDIFVNFNTGYYKKGCLIISRNNIAKHYVKSSFFLDILSVLPILLEFLRMESYTLLKWLFFLRISNFFRIFSKIEESIHINFKIYNLITLLKVVARIVLLSHAFACGWHAVSYSSYIEGQTQNWLNFYGLQDEIWLKKYITSYYFVCVTMNTVGYGDYTPQNYTEKIFCIFFIYAACGIFAYTLNVVGNIIQQISKNKSKFHSNIMTINEYMNKKNINFDLRMRIRKYLEYVWLEEQSQNSEEESVIIEKLSKSLREELLLETNGKLLRQIPFFTDNFSEETLTKFVIRLKELHFMPGDLIYQRGDHVNPSLFIVGKGEVQLYMENNQANHKDSLPLVLQKISKGNVFGEKEFVTGYDRELSARSSSFSTVYQLEAEDFQAVLRENSEDFSKFCEIRHKTCLFNDFSEVGIFCAYCQERTHSIIECPSLHLCLQRQRLIHKYCSHQPNERVFRERHAKKALNARKKLKFYQFIVKTIQKEQVFTEEDLVSANNYGNSEQNSENQECRSSSNNEIESSEETSFDFFRIMPTSYNNNGNNNPNISNNISNNVNNNGNNLNNIINTSNNLSISINHNNTEKKIPDFKVNSFENPHSRTPTDKRLPSDIKKSLINNRLISNNSIRVKTSRKEELDKTTELLYIWQFFEKKAEFNNFFPHNNCCNTVNQYNLSLENRPFLNKFPKRKSKKFLGRAKTLRRNNVISAFDNNDCKNVLQNLKKPLSPLKKSGFFQKDKENAKNEQNFDRKSMVTLLKLRKKEKEKGIFKRSFAWMLSFFKEDE